MGDNDNINEESFLLDESVGDNDFSGNSLGIISMEEEGLTSVHHTEGDAIIRAGKLEDSYFASQLEGEVAWRTFDTAWSNMLNSEQNESGDAATLEMKEDLTNAAEQLLKMRKWRNEVEPKLKEQECRPPFLLDDYRQTVFDWMMQNKSSVETETQFSYEGSDEDEKISRTQTDLTDIFRGRQRWEVGRLFVTLLLLRNNGNIDLTIHDDEDQESEESFNFTVDSPSGRPIASDDPSTPSFSGLLLSEEFYNTGNTRNRVNPGDSVGGFESPILENMTKGTSGGIVPVSQSYIRSTGLTRQISSTQGRNTRKKMMMELLDLEKGLAYKLEGG